MPFDVGEPVADVAGTSRRRIRRRRLTNKLHNMLISASRRYVCVLYQPII